jgi:hypothetical protein
MRYSLKHTLEIIASEMQELGLDPTNEDNLDSYLNSRIM